MLKGIPVSPGVAIGKVFLLDSEDFIISRKKIPAKNISNEIVRFEEALIKTRKEILNIQDKISKDMGYSHGEIFNAHLLVLEDRMLIEEVISRLKKEKLCVESVFSTVLKKYIKVFSNMNDQYLRERLSDIDDVGKRVIRNLLGKKRSTLENLKEKVIVVAYDLSPSDTASMHKKNVIGFVTDIGGPTSHTAIMAKSLEIPAVVGLEGATERISSGDKIIVDGNQGVVVVNPSPQTTKKYQKIKKRWIDFGKGLRSLRDLPAETRDKHKVILSANLELPEEIPSVHAHGANGIGLYRTEYFYMNRVGLPNEDEHYEAYKKVASEIFPDSVVIRTLDLGGDKFLSQLEVPYEMNPFLGWRAIRLSLAKPELFKIQLRAILRASAHGNLKIMYPMISGIEELRQANAILKQMMQELKKEKIKFDENIEVGAMIEVPSAALTCDILAKEVDFFSIGTNDLIQYSLAVDRINEKIAYLYDPAHPAVLRLIKNIIDAGHKKNIWVGMCGEMAGDPPLALLLLGLGLDEFSVSPVVLPEIKKIIRSVNLTDAQIMAKKALSLSTGKKVKEFMKKELKKILPIIEIV